MNSENSRLEKLLEEQEKVEDRIKQIQIKKNSQKRKLMAEKIINQIEAQQSTNKRAIETRKKILLGAMLQEWVRTGEIEQSTLDQRLVVGGLNKPTILNSTSDDDNQIAILWLFAPPSTRSLPGERAGSGVVWISWFRRGGESGGLKLADVKAKSLGR